MGEGRVKSLKTYLPAAFGAFLASTTGANVLARMKIANEPFAAALQESLYWSGVQFIGTIFLLAPFALIALICAFVETQAPARANRISAVFFIAMLPLIYFYFQGHFAAQQAMKEEHWTGAALSVGLLPFFIGAPAVILTFCAAAFAAGFDRETPD